MRHTNFLACSVPLVSNTLRQPNYRFSVLGLASETRDDLSMFLGKHMEKSHFIVWKFAEITG